MWSGEKKNKSVRRIHYKEREWFPLANYNGKKVITKTYQSAPLYFCLQIATPHSELKVSSLSAESLDFCRSFRILRSLRQISIWTHSRTLSFLKPCQRALMMFQLHCPAGRPMRWRCSFLTLVPWKVLVAITLPSCVHTAEASSARSCKGILKYVLGFSFSWKASFLFCRRYHDGLFLTERFPRIVLLLNSTLAYHVLVAAVMFFLFSQMVTVRVSWHCWTLCLQIRWNLFGSSSGFFIHQNFFQFFSSFHVQQVM